MANTKFLDQTDYVSRSLPLRRILKIDFDGIKDMGEYFEFRSKGNILCRMDKGHFSDKQKDFFNSISDP